MGIWLRNKTQNPLPLPYPFRGFLPAGGRVALDLTQDEAYTALALQPGEKQNFITVEDGANGPFNDLMIGDAKLGTQSGVVGSAAQFGFIGNALGTTITSPGVFVPIVGVTVAGLENNWELLTGNAMSYQGANPVFVTAAMAFTAFKALGTASVYTFAAFRNGVQAGPGYPAELTASISRTIVGSVGFTVEKGNLIDFRVAATPGTDDIVVDNMDVTFTVIAT